MRTALVLATLLAGCAAAPSFGEGVAAMRARPGRYTGAFELDSGLCCSQSCGATHARASVSLTLDPRGGATLCRARTGITRTASGPGVEATAGQLGAPPGTQVDEHRLDERRTMRGNWHGEGAWLRVDLAPDAPQAGEQPWSLRCVEVSPRGPHAPVPVPLLACELVGDMGVESVGYTACVPQLWHKLFLSVEPGLVVRSRELGMQACEGTTFERGGAGPGAACDDAP